MPNSRTWLKLNMITLVCPTKGWSVQVLFGRMRLSLIEALAARRQKHCSTMDLTAQRPILLHLNWIRMRHVHRVTKVTKATEAAIAKLCKTDMPFHEITK